MSGQHPSAMNEEQIPVEKGLEAHSDEKEKDNGKADAEPKQTASFGNYFVRAGPSGYVECFDSRLRPNRESLAMRQEKIELSL